MGDVAGVADLNGLSSVKIRNEGMCSEGSLPARKDGKMGRHTYPGPHHVLNPSKHAHVPHTVHRFVRK